MATTALPYPHLERATSGLRAELRHRGAEQGQQLLWATLEVTGPVKMPDALGHSWWEYRATVAATTG